MGGLKKGKTVINMLQGKRNDARVLIRVSMKHRILRLPHALTTPSYPYSLLLPLQYYSDNV